MVRNTKGFSLIELMIVVVIIGILAAIAIPNYISMQNRAKEGSVKGNAHSLQLAVEDFAVTNAGTYPIFGDIAATMFPGGNWPDNPFTGAPEAVVAATGAFTAQGSLGYAIAAGVYTIEGCGYDNTAGPAANGVVIALTNG
jgi:prepilin-type N-terminal cleavage/methylation domain-containing protein